jgi:hypothetical protein
MRLIIAVAACLLLAGCVRTVTTPDGQEAFYIRCIGQGCLTRPARACPQGYDVIDDREVVIGAFAGGTGSVQTARDLTFTCKA